MDATTKLDGRAVESQIRLTSEEINTLVYMYLQESNFPHAAFALLTESALPSTSVFQRYSPSYPDLYPPSVRRLSSAAAGRANGSSRTGAAIAEPGDSDVRIPRGELVRKMWKALRWEEIEQHATQHNSDTSCSSPFHLLLPHRCELRGGSQNSGAVCPPPCSTMPITAPDEANFSKREPEEQVLSNPSPTRESYPPSSSPTRNKRKGSHESTPAEATHADEDLYLDSRDGLITESHPHLVDQPTTSRSSFSKSPENLTPSGRPQSKRARIEDRKAVSQMQKSYPHPELKKGVSSLPASEGNTWVEHRDSITCLSWNPRDKEVLASSSNDGTARLWHFMEPVEPGSNALRLEKKPSSISHKSIDSGKKSVTALVWHPDGTVFATASDGVGRLFTPSGQLQGILTYGRGAINALKFNPSGTSLLAAKDDFTICLFVLDFDLKSPKQLSFEAHSKEVNDVDWLDDDIFASGGNDHTIFIFRANERRPRFTLKGHSDDVTRVKWSPRQQGVPDHHRLLASVADDGTMMIWKLPHYPADRSTSSRSLSPSKLSRDKESSADDFVQVTVAPGSEYCRNRLQVVDSDTDNKRMNTLEWSPNCREGHMIVAAGGQDSTVKLFNAETGECLHTLSGLEAGTGSIAFSPITSTARPEGVIAAGGWNGKLCFWDVKTGESLKEYEVDEEPGRQSSRDRPMMSAMSWRHDGQHLAAGLHNKSLMTISTAALM